jgi:hypothetical protein
VLDVVDDFKETSGNEGVGKMEKYCLSAKYFEDNCQVNNMRDIERYHSVID